MKQILTYKNGLQLAYAEYGSQSGYPILVQHGLIASIDDGDLFGCLLENQARGEGAGFPACFVMQAIELANRLIEALG